MVFITEDAVGKFAESVALMFPNEDDPGLVINRLGLNACYGKFFSCPASSIHCHGCLVT